MPMFPEALMLHYMDDLDSKMESMRTQFLREPDSEWTAYNPSLERPLLNSKKFLEKVSASEDGSGGQSSETVAAAASPLPTAKSFETCLITKKCQFWSRRLVNLENLRSMDFMEVCKWG